MQDSVQLHPAARLQWTKCANVPASFTKAQVVVMGESVCVGGGYSFGSNDREVLIYNRRQDCWSHLPICPVKWFGMTQFKGKLITVGGILIASGLPSGMVLALSPDCRRWELFIPPMPTARYNLAVFTTTTAIVAAGGCIRERVPNVEVYNNDTSQWYSTDPLPNLRKKFVSAVIGNFCYVMEGTDFYKANLVSLIHKATSPSPSLSTSKSLWERLPSPPLNNSSLVNLKGSLMAVGGTAAGRFLGLEGSVVDRFVTNVSPAVFIFINNTWVRLENGDMPVPRESCSSGQLSSHEIIVIGGLDVQNSIGQLQLEGNRHLRDTYIGTF